MSSTSEKRFAFSTLLILETARSQLKPSQESTAHEPWQICSFVVKTATLAAKNVPVRCGVEGPMSDLSTTLLA
jgi:hypothetical protein